MLPQLARGALLRPRMLSTQTLMRCMRPFSSQAKATAPPAQPAAPTVFVDGGVARLKLALGKESHLFTLSASSSVGRFAKSVQEEGNAKNVVVRSSDGTRIAQSTAIADLLRSGDFTLTVDDKSIAVKTSSEAKQLATQASDVGNIRSTVAALHASLHSDREESVEVLEGQLRTLQAEFEPLKTIRDDIDDSAHGRADRAMLFGIGLMGVQFGVLARLTWWEYSWDIIEPVTYFVTYGSAIMAAGYYFVTKRDFEYSAEKERRAELAFAKIARSKNLDVNRYNSLIDAIHQVEADIAGVRRREEIVRAVAKEAKKADL